VRRKKKGVETERDEEKRAEGGRKRAGTDS